MRRRSHVGPSGPPSLPCSLQSLTNAPRSPTQKRVQPRRDLPFIQPSDRADDPAVRLFTEPHRGADGQAVRQRQVPGHDVRRDQNQRERPLCARDRPTARMPSDSKHRHEHVYLPSFCFAFS